MEEKEEIIISDDDNNNKEEEEEGEKKEKGTTYKEGYGVHRIPLVVLHQFAIHLFHDHLQQWLQEDAHGCVVLPPEFWSDESTLAMRKKFSLREHVGGYVISSFGGK